MTVLLAVFEFPPKKITCPLGKLRTEFTSPIANPLVPGYTCTCISFLHKIDVFYLRQFIVLKDMLTA